MKYADLIDILGRALGPELADRASVAIRAEAAGEYVYIPRRTAIPEVASTATPRAVAERYGVSRATAHRWVTRWR